MAHNLYKIQANGVPFSCLPLCLSPHGDSHVDHIQNDKNLSQQTPLKHFKVQVQPSFFPFKTNPKKEEEDRRHIHFRACQVAEAAELRPFRACRSRVRVDLGPNGLVVRSHIHLHFRGILVTDDMVLDKYGVFTFQIF